LSLDKIDLSKRLAALTQRERTLLFVGVAVMLFGMGYAFIFAPLQIESKRIQQQIQAQQQIYQYLQGVEQRVSLLRQSAIDSPVTPVDVPAVITESSQQLALQGDLQQQNATPDSVEVVMQKIPFNQLMNWLAVLHQQHGLVVSVLDTQLAEAGSGIVNGRLTLTAPDH
jgi:type II secretory pathway component PulM